MNDWLLLFLLSLGTYRLTRLVVLDTFPPILWARDRLVGGWREVTEQEREAGISDGTDSEGDSLKYNVPVSWSPFWLRELLSCPWCASGWLAGLLVGSTAVVSSVPLPALFWLASWALGALLASQEWS